MGLVWNYIFGIAFLTICGMYLSGQIHKDRDDRRKRIPKEYSK
jgi:hypothetical protein